MTVCLNCTKMRKRVPDYACLPCSLKGSPYKIVEACKHDRGFDSDQDKHGVNFEYCVTCKTRFYRCENGMEMEVGAEV